MHFEIFFLVLFCPNKKNFLLSFLGDKYIYIYTSIPTSKLPPNALYLCTIVVQKKEKESKTVKFYKVNIN